VQGEHDTTDRRRRRRLAVRISAGLVAFAVVLTAGITAFRVAHEQPPLEARGGGVCGGAEDGSTGPHLAVSIRYDNRTDRVAHIDRIAAADLHGLESVHLSAAVVPPARGDSDQGNAVGPDVRSVAAGHTMGRTSNLSVPVGDGLLVVADMRLDDHSENGWFTGLTVHWTGSFGTQHRTLLRAGVGLSAPTHLDSCLPVGWDARWPPRQVS